MWTVIYVSGPDAADVVPSAPLDSPLQLCMTTISMAYEPAREERAAGVINKSSMRPCSVVIISHQSHVIVIYFHADQLRVVALLLLMARAIMQRY